MYSRLYSRSELGDRGHGEHGVWVGPLARMYEYCKLVFDNDDPLNFNPYLTRPEPRIETMQKPLKLGTMVLFFTLRPLRPRIRQITLIFQGINIPHSSEQDDVICTHTQSLADLWS